MQGVKIEKIKPVSAADPRGVTFELFKGYPGQQVTFYRRREGAVFADHFHKGEDPSKNPELFFLLDGRVQFEAANPLTAESLRQEIDSYTMLTIEKGIWHRFTALTDVAFVEYRSTVFDPLRPDTFPAVEYQDYIESCRQNSL